MGAFLTRGIGARSFLSGPDALRTVRLLGFLPPRTSVDELFPHRIQGFG